MQRGKNRSLCLEVPWLACQPKFPHSGAQVGGEGEIRTPETFWGLLAFQASALGHYATSPILYSGVVNNELLFNTSPLFTLSITHFA